MTEEWLEIPEFPTYLVSSEGRVFNQVLGVYMSVSYTNHGHGKVTLRLENGIRRTRSVALLVASAFCDRPTILFDAVIVLDGNLSDLRASNLAWRPSWFAWKYKRQQVEPQPIHYHNLAVVNTITGEIYDSIAQAAKAEGLLHEDIWRSTYRGVAVFPTGSIFEVCEEGV